MSKCPVLVVTVIILSVLVVVDGGQSYTQIKKHCADAMASIDANKENGKCCVNYLRHRCEVLRCQRTSGQTKQDCKLFWTAEIIVDQLYLDCQISASNFEQVCSAYNIDEADTAAGGGGGGDNSANDNSNQSDQGGGGGKGTGVAIAVVVVLVVAIAGAYYWFYVRKSGKDKKDKKSAKEVSPSKKSKSSKSKASRKSSIRSKKDDKKSAKSEVKKDKKSDEKSAKSEVKKDNKSDAKEEKKAEKKSAIVKSGKVDVDKMMKAIEL